MLGILLKSFCKSRKLQRISRKLGKPISYSVNDIFADSDAKKTAEEELFDLIESDPNLMRILASHGADRKTLHELYNLGLAAGLAVWVEGHWVAASALAFGPTLDFILSQGCNPSAESIDDIGNKLIAYFYYRKVGRVS